MPDHAKKYSIREKFAIEIAESSKTALELREFSSLEIAKVRTI